MSRRTVVVSAVNFTEGGPLTVLRECLASAVESLPQDWDIVALVNNRSLLNLPRVRLIEIPDAKRAWWRRLRWEWLGFHRLSRKLQPDLWLSLHDITPRVQAGRQAVYCHNPSPFYSLSPREMLLEPKLVLFRLFYAHLYRLLIGRNTHVIVQQQWLRDEFRRRFGHALPVVVAHPAPDTSPTRGRHTAGVPYVFLYPALPRVFKNLQVLGEAAQLLQARGITGFEIRLTVDGSENRYARWLKARFGSTPGLAFLGRQSRQQMAAHYAQAHALLFPSKLETWGLPITEAKQCGLPMLVADAAYSRETVGDYDRVDFFAPDDAASLATLMQAMIDGNWQPAGNAALAQPAPFAENWAALWQLLTDGPPLHQNDARPISFDATAQ